MTMNTVLRSTGTTGMFIRAKIVATMSRRPFQYYVTLSLSWTGQYLADILVAIDLKHKVIAKRPSPDGQRLTPLVSVDLPSSRYPAVV